MCTSAASSGDARKAADIERKHGIAFARVAEFDFAAAGTIRDTRRDYGEPRYLSLGYLGDRLHVIAWTLRGSRIRIISLRRANERERTRYERNS